MQRVVVPALLAFACAACNGHATGDIERTEPPTVHVETAQAIVDDVEVTVQAVGTLQPHRRVEIRSRTEGVVEFVLIEDGEHVEVDTPLVRLDMTKLAAEVRLKEAALAAARARAANARRSFSRARDLSDRGFIPEQELDDRRATSEEATAAVAETEAALVVAQTLLRDADFRAPIAGVAGELAVDPGDYLRNGDHVLTIIDADPVEVEFMVPEEHLARLAVGQDVSVRVPSYPEERFTGKVTYIEPEVLQETRSVRLKATIPNPDERLRPGQFATVRAVLAVHANAVLVPEEAIVPEGAATWVYVVQDGHALRRKVELGQRRLGQAEVTTGLTGTETVVVSGHVRLRDGSAIRTAASAPAEG